MKTVADVAIKLLKDNQWTEINIGHYGMLDEIYFEALKQKIITDTKHHPLDRQVYIMSLLRKIMYTNLESKIIRYR